MEDIEKVIIHMLQNDGIFYASLLGQVRRIKDKNYDHVAGIGIRNGRIELRWNPDLFSKYKKIKEKAAICAHEMEHICKNHIGRLKDKHRETWYLAADLAINQSIPNIPSDGLHLDSFPNLNLAKNKAAEYYYEKLKQNQSNSKSKVSFKKNGDGKSKIVIQGDNGSQEFDMDQPDDHSQWEQSKNKGEEVKEILKQAVERAVEQTQRMRGKIPLHLEEDVNNLLKESVIPWWNEMKNWIGNSVKSGRKYTWKRPNRRFGIYQKGRLPDHLVKVVIAIDTSGSMDTQELKEAFTEVRSILENYRHDITLIQCDTDIQSVEKISRHDVPKFKIKGRGGTDFRPVFDYVDEKRLVPDLIIFFTDMEGTFPEKEPHYATLWVTVGESIKPPFGRLLSIPEKKAQKRLYNL